MATHTRVVDLSNGTQPKLSRAKRLVDVHCTHKWVTVGKEIDRRTVAEMLQAQAERKEKSEALPLAEGFGLKFDHPGTPVERKLAYDAVIFHLEQVAPHRCTLHSWLHLERECPQCRMAA